MTRIEMSFDHELNRLAAYQYLEPWLRNRRVLELGCGQGHGLRQLFALGAQAVVGLDRDPRRCAPRVAALEDVVSLRSYRPPRLGLVAGSFDVVIVNDSTALLGPQPTFSELRAALVPEGLLVVRVESGDQAGAPGGVTYGELLDLLEPVFPEVRVFGQSPFVAYSIVELTEEVSGKSEELDLSLDGALMGGAAEEVGAYLVLCGSASALRRPSGYGILQVPSQGDVALERWWDSLAQEEPEDDGDIPPFVETRDAPRTGDRVVPERAPEIDSPGAMVMRVGPDDSGRPDMSGNPAVDGRNLPDGQGQPSERPTLESLSDSGGGFFARWRWPRLT